MVVDNKDYKANVLVLLMPGEEKVTVETVETLLEGIEDGVTISVLMNGGSDRGLKELFSRHDAVKYYESEKNLGVAGGRNYLFNTDEGREADIILMLDNDVVPSLDYVRSIVTFLLAQPDVALVGPAIADIRFACPMVTRARCGGRGVFGNRIFKLSSGDIKGHVLNDFQPKKVYHLGTHTDYYWTYFSLRPFFSQLLGRPLRFAGLMTGNRSPAFRDDTDCQKLLLDGADKLSVGNVGGGTQVFRRSLLDDIGLLDNKFNPYGYEDVEFSIRALKAGYKNYIDLNTWIYHGTDTRHRLRDPLYMFSNTCRCLTLCAASAMPERFKRIIWKYIIFWTFIECITLNRDAFKRFKARYRGMKMAEEALNDEAEDKRRRGRAASTNV